MTRVRILLVLARKNKEESNIGAKLKNKLYVNKYALHTYS